VEEKKMKEGNKERRENRDSR